MIENSGIEIGPKIENIPVLLKFIGNSMSNFGLSEYEDFQVQLAVEEAVTNIINHGDLKENQKISIKCKKDVNGLIIVIEDQGEPFDPTKVVKPDFNTSPLKRGPGGLGVYFIKKYMNRVNYEFKDDKNILTLIKRI